MRRAIELCIRRRRNFLPPVMPELAMRFSTTLPLPVLCTGILLMGVSVVRALDGSTAHAFLDQYVGQWQGHYELTRIEDNALVGELRTRQHYAWGEIEGQRVLFVRTTFRQGGQERHAEGAIYLEGDELVRELTQGDVRKTYVGRLREGANIVEWRLLTDEGLSDGDVLAEEFTRNDAGEMVILTDAVEVAQVMDLRLRIRGAAVKVRP